jgi:predicted heme/steroid binding protein
MSKTAATAVRPDNGERIFTLQELTQYDGLNGSPAYLAIHGIVYDVTSVQLLRDGRHHDVFPGRDVSEQFVHNQAILNRLQVIGRLG